jgi:hypothetical protein
MTPIPADSLRVALSHTLYLYPHLPDGTITPLYHACTRQTKQSSLQLLDGFLEKPRFHHAFNYIEDD